MGHKRRLLAAQMEAIEAHVDAELAYERDPTDDTLDAAIFAQGRMIEVMGAQEWELRRKRKEEKAERLAEQEDFTAMLKQMVGRASLESF